MRSGAVNLYLAHDVRANLDEQARGHSMSLSAYVTALAQLMDFKITMKTPMAEVRHQFHKLLREEIRRRTDSR